MRKSLGWPNVIWLAFSATEVLDSRSCYLLLPWELFSSLWGRWGRWGPLLPLLQFQLRLLVTLRWRDHRVEWLQFECRVSMSTLGSLSICCGTSSPSPLPYHHWTGNGDGDNSFAPMALTFCTYLYQGAVNWAQRLAGWSCGRSCDCDWNLFTFPFFLCWQQNYGCHQPCS